MLTQANDNRSNQPAGPPTRWQENHGNLLSGFVAIVLLTGVCILFYRQSRFVPPRFPEAEMITTPEPAEVEENDDQATDMVIIKVTGAISDKGFINIAIYGSESDFAKTANAVATNSALIVEGESEWRISPKKLPSKFAVAAYHDENDDGLIEAPLHIEFQVQHQLLVSGYQTAYIAVLVGGNTLKLIKRERNEKVITSIKNKIQLKGLSQRGNAPEKGLKIKY